MVDADHSVVTIRQSTQVLNMTVYEEQSVISTTKSNRLDSLSIHRVSIDHDRPVSHECHLRRIAPSQQFAHKVGRLAIRRNWLPAVSWRVRLIYLQHTSLGIRIASARYKW